MVMNIMELNLRWYEILVLFVDYCYSFTLKCADQWVLIGL